MRHGTWDDESSCLPALFLTSLHINVCASKMSLFKDAALPGFRGTGLSNAVNWSSVGVCPGAQAAKAKRAREETPLFVNALTSSAIRETSAALLLRALVDSRDALMLLNRQKLRIKRTHM